MMATPRSLGSRLILAAFACTASAMLAAGVLAWTTLDRFVHWQVDLALENQINALASAVAYGPDGALRLAYPVGDRPFSQPFSGWYWQIAAGGSILTSPSLVDGRLDLALSGVPLPPPPRAGGPDIVPQGRARALVADVPGPHGQALHIQTLTVVVAGGSTAKIMVTAPAAALRQPVTQTMMTVLLALGIASVLLVLATRLQVRLGLRPLDHLRDAITEVRNGTRSNLPEAQPDEIRPLVIELNKLLSENEQGLERARRHVANLAHGLKTPLANLSLAIDGLERADGELPVLVSLMERRIRHHLGRARVAALSGGVRSRSHLLTQLRDLLVVLERIHADRPISVDLAVADDLHLACEAQDLDEMFGNILDNGFRFARSIVTITARRDGQHVAIVISDDGPGIEDDDVANILRPGVRLDETEAGYGFGLPIAQELAELYGGSLSIGRPRGGAEIVITLPASL